MRRGVDSVWARLVTAAVAEAALALGYTFYSGSLDAWVVDSAALTGRDELRRVFSRAHVRKNVWYGIAWNTTVTPVIQDVDLTRR